MLDTQTTFHLIWIKQADEYRMAFQTSYCQFKYGVVFFGLTNPLVIFQSYIGNWLPSYMDNIAIAISILFWFSPVMKRRMRQK